MKTISWFSAGVSSAVATKLAIEDIDQIIYTHIEDQHPDTMRFVKDCEAWFGKSVEIMQSPYMDVETALRQGGIINGPKVRIRCTDYLKRRVRREWEVDQLESGEELTYIWGMDLAETARAERIPIHMKKVAHRFPLIEREITKVQAHEILKASGIARPAMYDLGYHNNNCIGCIRGGMGYWNHIRVDFPEVFKARAELERVMKSTCIKGIYLDELDPERGRHAPPIVDDCGIMCELIALPTEETP